MDARTIAPQVPQRQYRAECWASMREWLKAGAIPGDLELVAELTGR
jgi:hypothetical protein